VADVQPWVLRVEQVPLCPCLEREDRREEVQASLGEPVLLPAVSSIDSPAGVSEAFVAAINAGDLAGALGLYREDAVLLAPDGQCVRGAKAIEGLLAGLLQMQVQMETRIERVIEAGDVALATETWTMRPHAPDGIGEHSGQSIVLFTHGDDGWRLLIDAPWGLTAPPLDQKRAGT
jgi:uncharacterized protein (TIGR02246 family)